VFQTPGALETMRDRICTQMRGIHLVQGAGHWVQQEEPDQVSDILVRFLFELR
jgi:pimeloyl-ACP methyl ester carboxylesterase